MGLLFSLWDMANGMNVCLNHSRPSLLSVHPLGDVAMPPIGAVRSESAGVGP